MLISNVVDYGLLMREKVGGLVRWGEGRRKILGSIRSLHQFVIVVVTCDMENMPSGRGGGPSNLKKGIKGSFKDVP